MPKDKPTNIQQAKLSADEDTSAPDIEFGVETQSDRVLTFWQAPDRDSPAGAAIDADFQFDITDSSNEHLSALLQMDGLNGYDEAEVLRKTSRKVSRPRRWSKFFERMGIMNREGQVTRLTDLGHLLANITNASKAEYRRRLAEMAIGVLSQYQLKNPADEIDGHYPDDCDVFPYWCIWKAADALDGKLHWDELNRELMRVLRMKDLDSRIDRISTARRDPDYNPATGGSKAHPLDPRCHTEVSPPAGKTADGQVRDHYMTPWLKRAGFGGLLLTAPGKGGEGYWTIPEDIRPLLQAALKTVPVYRHFETKEKWFEHFGKLKEQIGGITLDLALPENDKLWLEVKSLLDSGSLAIVLTGPPGTSKTWYASRLAAKIAGSVDRVCTVQFHPSFSYDDFVEGYIPSSASQRSIDGALFEIKPKVFLQLCEQARQAPDQIYVLVIDEINRGDVSRVLGELVTYMEPAYRGAPFTLAYSGKRTSIPKNIIVIGTMNPYDRSITEMDDALERRFQRIFLPPDTAILAKLLKEAGAEGALMEKTIKFFQKANELAPHGFGHTYFVGVKREEDLVRLWNHMLRFVFEKMFRFDTDKLSEVRTAFAATLTDASSLL
jgi:5-methylcytosine-specific restriction protein B